MLLFRQVSNLLTVDGTKERKNWDSNPGLFGSKTCAFSTLSCVFRVQFFSFFFCLPFCSPLSVVQVASFKWLTTASKSWAVTSSPTYQSFLLDTSCLKTVQRTWSSVSKPSNLNWHHLFLSAFSVVADLPASYTPADCPPAPSHPAYAAGSSGMLHMSSSNCDGTPQPVTSHTLLLTAP